MGDFQVYTDAAAAFRYHAQKKVNEAARLDSKAARCRTLAQENLRLAEEMDAKARVAAPEPTDPVQGAAKP